LAVPVKNFNETRADSQLESRPKAWRQTGDDRLWKQSVTIFPTT
jgi:hypothetical protein